MTVYHYFRMFHKNVRCDKWLVIAHRTGFDKSVIYAIYSDLMSYASQNTPRGSLDGYDPEECAIYWGFDESTINTVREELARCGLIDEENCNIQKWDKEQKNVDGNSTERSRRSRAKKKQEEQEKQEQRFNATSATVAETVPDVAATVAVHTEHNITQQNKTKQTQNTKHVCARASDELAQSSLTGLDPLEDKRNASFQRIWDVLTNTPEDAPYLARKPDPKSLHSALVAFKREYPRVSIEMEASAMRNWLIARYQKKGETVGNLVNFVNNWLKRTGEKQRAQDVKSVTSQDFDELYEIDPNYKRSHEK